MPCPARVALSRVTLSVVVLAAVVGGLSGCARFPALDAATSQDAMRAPWPRLQPLPPIIAAGEAGTVTEATTGAIEARGEALRRRAAALRRAGTE